MDGIYDKSRGALVVLLLPRNERKIHNERSESGEGDGLKNILRTPLVRSFTLKLISSPTGALAIFM